MGALDPGQGLGLAGELPGEDAIAGFIDNIGAGDGDAELTGREIEDFQASYLGRRWGKAQDLKAGTTPSLSMSLLFLAPFALGVGR